MVLSPSAENLEEKVFLENDAASDSGSDGSDGYEQQAVQRNSFGDDMYDELKESDSENGYIENYGPEVLAAKEAMLPGSENVKNLDDGHTKIKDDRLKSDSDIVIRPKTNILDLYAKVDKRSLRLSSVMSMEESASKRSSVASEYSDILSAVLKVSNQFTEKHQTFGFGRSMSFDTGASLRAVVEKVRDLDAIAAKEYESFQELHNSRAGSSERELQSSSGGSNSIEGIVVNASKDESTVIMPVCGASQTINGATAEVTVPAKSITVKKSAGRSKEKTGSRRPRSEVLYPEISNSFGSLDEIYTSDSSSDEDSSVPRTLPNLDEEKEKMSVKSFTDISDRKKDSGICGDSNESISALIKDEGAKVLDEVTKIEYNSEKPKTVDSMDKVLTGSFVNTPTSVYAKEHPVNVDDSSNDKNSSQNCADESDHEYDDIDEKKRNSYLPLEATTSTGEKLKSVCGQEDENVYDEIDKEAEGEGEGQGSKVIATSDNDAETGSQEHHDYADVDDKEKIESAEGGESDHEYDPIEFQGAPPDDDGKEMSESEYEEYDDHEESIEIIQKRASKYRITQKNVNLLV
jgi:hypothetical protein